LQRAASSQRRSQRPPSLSPTQWTGSYGSPSPPTGSDIEAEYPAARPTVYQPWSTVIDSAPMQVVADSRQPGSTVDPRIYVPEMSTFVSLAAEVQPHVEHTPIRSSGIGIRSVAGHALSKGVDVARLTPAHVTPTHDTPTHASMSAGLTSAAHAVCPSSVGAHQWCSGAGTHRNAVPVNILGPERRSGSYPSSQAKRYCCSVPANVCRQDRICLF